MSLADRLAQAAKAIIAAIVALITALFGGAREAGALLMNDARRVVRVARGAVEATARVVGTGLAGPARVLDAAAGAIGSTLGAMLPRRPVGPRDVADAAVAGDNTRDSSITPMPAKARAELETSAMVGSAIHAAAASLACGDDALAERQAAGLPSEVRAWLVALTPREIARLIATDGYHVVAHVEGRHPAAGLPPVPAAAAPITDRAQMQAALAEIRRIARAERLEAVERATGGGRPAALPTRDDDYVPPRPSRQGPRPAFH